MNIRGQPIQHCSWPLCQNAQDEKKKKNIVKKPHHKPVNFLRAKLNLDTWTLQAIFADLMCFAQSSFAEGTYLLYPMWTRQESVFYGILVHQHMRKGEQKKKKIKKN